MKVTSLVENTSASGLHVEHGLSLHMALANGESLLFDMGQHRLFAENALRLGIDLTQVSKAILSHGHYDHGGGLRAFLLLNQQAQVYVHQQAFMPHYSLRDKGLAYIGLDQELQAEPRLTFCDARTPIAPGLTLFADVQGQCCCPPGNHRLFGPSPSELDAFPDEQNLLIMEGNNLVLVAGCAHKGIVNILRKAEQVCGKAPTHVLSGMHLFKSGLSPSEEDAFISTLANELMQYEGCQFYTMHCTGVEQYQKLCQIMGSQIEYLSCGDSIEI